MRKDFERYAGEVKAALMEDKAAAVCGHGDIAEGAAIGYDNSGVIIPVETEWLEPVPFNEADTLDFPIEALPAPLCTFVEGLTGCWWTTPPRRSWWILWMTRTGVSQ